MGIIFTLTSDILSPTQQLFDDIINEMGRDCKIYYPPNVIAATQTTVLKPVGQASQNSVLTGGSNPFPSESISAVEGGQGQESETFDTVKLLLHYNPSHFGQMKLDQTRLDKGLVKTGGFLVDLPKILQCAYLMDNTMDGYGHFKYRLCEKPISNNNIVQGRYFEALWERIQ